MRVPHASRIEQALARRPARTAAFIAGDSELLQALRRGNVALCQALAARGNGKSAALEHDGTIIESHKQQGLPHDKGGRGFPPAAIDWAEQDVVAGSPSRRVSARKPGPARNAA